MTIQGSHVALSRRPASPDTVIEPDVPVLPPRGVSKFCHSSHCSHIKLTSCPSFAVNENGRERIKTFDVEEEEVELEGEQEESTEPDDLHQWAAENGYYQGVYI
jgi:hypothetical protein